MNFRILKTKRDYQGISETRNTQKKYRLCNRFIKIGTFGGTENTINLGKLLCGSEGTLAFTTEITLKVDHLPPTYNVMVVAHFHTIQESLEAVVTAMKHHLYTCEMMDDTMNCTKTTESKPKNRFYSRGPKAVIMLEVASHNSMEDAEIQANDLLTWKEIILGMLYQKLEQILIK
jgi:FAD/FMN-containing dehydrogenase